ncbi:MAG: hypothetical protein K0S71_3113 [Clostridia bacterium]|jgi:hypothetical protein|nr:hypothetical protein [Clostridia bacterium]
MPLIKLKRALIDSVEMAIYQGFFGVTPYFLNLQTAYSIVFMIEAH